ncbi:MAG: hypothetical protein LBC07_03435 [Elusimicrobiota bacterium]|jgi:hypothetical protein|nr:hypothetical protein [Elusimicrobiota bacterium]
MQKVLAAFLSLLILFGFGVCAFAQGEYIDLNSYELIDYLDIPELLKNVDNSSTKKFKSVAIFYRENEQNGYMFSTADAASFFILNSSHSLDISGLNDITKRITIYYTVTKTPSANKIVLDYIDKDSANAAQNERILASKTTNAPLDKSQYQSITMDKYINEESAKAEAGSIRKYRSLVFLKYQGLSNYYLLIDPKTKASTVAIINKRNIGATPTQIVMIYYTAAKTAEKTDTIMVDEIEVK